ncbi:UDP-N-acetylmuramoyl-tripeptide--D-alanyl-D-alanine ligase [Pontibacillus litoralis]|nr:UDP-N-acetylmuramoyl-tripeptide--D-alanyl-D-alanine ligase [Pontibacillus litoralis]
MKFTTSWMTEYFPSFSGAAAEEIPIHHVYTDTRQQTEKALFVPIVGENFDGHAFLQSAITNGAVASLWKKDVPVPAYVPNDFPLFMVEDTISALQQLAHAYRQEVNPTVIGVTGSNGKTTTKDFIASVVSTTYQTHKTKGNYNNHIGMPLTILDMPTSTQILILEMGMNHFGEIEQLSQIANPDIAVITNIGESHIEHLGSREGIAQAKSEILAGLKEDGLMIMDGDEALLAPLHSRKAVTSIGFGSNNRYVLSNVTSNEQGAQFTLSEQGSFEIPLLGRHNVKNASYAIVIANHLTISKESIQDGLAALKLTGMRLEKITGHNDVLLINDAYNASPTSMKASIEVVKELPNYSRKILVLGDILELGTQSESLHRSVAETITEPINMVIAIGNTAPVIVEEINKHVPTIETYAFRSKEDACKLLQDHLSKETVILFKASRGMALETLLPSLTEQ